MSEGEKPAPDPSEAARKHYARLFDRAPVAYFRLDRSATICEVNDAGARLVGSDPAALANRSFTDFVGPDSLAAFSTFLPAVFAEIADRTLQVVWRADGRVVSAELRAKRDDDATHCLVAVVDVHDRDLAGRHQVAAEVATIAHLHSLATRQFADDPEGLFANLVETTRAITAADLVYLHVFDPAIGALRAVAHYGVPPAQRERFGVIATGSATVAGVALTRRERVILEDLGRRPAFIDPSDLDVALAAGVRSAQATPLLSARGEVLAVLSTAWRTVRRAEDLPLAPLDVVARLGAGILEQRKFMDDLREVETRYRQFLLSVPDPMIVVDSRGIIEYANSHADQAFGYEPGELVGRDHAILVPDRARDVHAEHVRGFVQGNVAQLDGTGRSGMWGLRKDGSEFPIEVSLNRVGTTNPIVCTVIRDISERRRLEAAAELQSTRLAAAIETMPDVITIFDAQGSLVACNSAFKAMFPAACQGEARLGADALVAATAGLLGVDVARGWFDADEALPDIADARLADGRRLRLSTREMKDGGWVTTGVDLTDDLVRESELQIAKANAEGASKAKSEFLASMSHELRTPLNAVIGFCQLLRRDRKDHLTERQAEMVDQVARGGEHLLALIDDVLDLARIEANRVTISLEAVSVLDAVTEVVQVLGPVAEDAQVRLRIASPDDPLPAVEADPRRLTQILMNLASNAIKYNKRGGTVTFAVSTPDDGAVRVAVIDTGRGIPWNHQPKVFEPFQRAGQEGGPIEGTGIGLAISQRLAHLLHTTIRFESTPGSGSTFWLDLPIDGSKVATRLHRDAPPAPGPVVAPSLVLYVEDNPSAVAFMRSALTAIDGIEVATAPTAEEGLVVARERQPAVILMDINLPGMSGYAALSALKSSPETRRIPVVAVSAAASDADRKKGLQAGFYQYLTKPVQLDDLEATLRQILANQG